MLMRNQPTTLFQIFLQLMIIFSRLFWKMILEIIIGLDDTRQGGLRRQMV